MLEYSRRHSKKATRFQNQAASRGRTWNWPVGRCVLEHSINCTSNSNNCWDRLLLQLKAAFPCLSGILGRFGHTRNRIPGETKIRLLSFQISPGSIEQPHLKNGERQTDSATERLKPRGGEKDPCC